MSAAMQRDSSAEKGQARLAYLLALVLACLPALGVPILPWTAGVLVLIVLIVLLAPRFVGWHGMQALLTIILPVVLATNGGNIIVTCTLLPIAMLFLLLGLREAGRGRCRLLRLVSPQAELPRPWAVQAENAAAAQRTKYQRESDGYRAFLQGQSKLGVGMRAEAVRLFAQAYRKGNQVMRRRALEQLERLDEVESF